MEKQKEEGKERKKQISTSYTLQRMRTTIETLVEAKMVTKEEKDSLVLIYNTIRLRELGGELKL